MPEQQCLFCQIIQGHIPAKIIYRDDMIVCFHDIRPAAPVHLLIVPIEHLDSLAHAQGSHTDILAHILLMAPRLAQQEGSREGFRFVINTGRVGCQEVMHLHAHVLGGPDPLTIRKGLFQG